MIVPKRGDEDPMLSKTHDGMWNTRWTWCKAKKDELKFLNALILMCFLIVEAGEKISVAFGQKRTCNLGLSPLNFFMPRFCDHLSSDPSLTPWNCSWIQSSLAPSLHLYVFLDFVVTKTSSSPIVASFVHSVVRLSSLYTVYITHLGSSFYNHHSSCLHIACHDHDHLIGCHLIH